MKKATKKVLGFAMVLGGLALGLLGKEAIEKERKELIEIPEKERDEEEEEES